MIDLALLPEPWRSEYVAVPGVCSGEGLHPRSTLRMGDILLRRKRFTKTKAAGKALSLSCWPSAPDCYMVGRNVSIEQLYPALWGDWNWEEPH